MVASDNAARKQENKELVFARQSQAATFTSQEILSFKGSCLQMVELYETSLNSRIQLLYIN